MPFLGKKKSDLKCCTILIYDNPQNSKWRFGSWFETAFLQRLLEKKIIRIFLKRYNDLTISANLRPQTHIQTQLSTVHQFVLIKTKCKEFCISILDVILWFYDDTRACIGYISQTFWHMLAVPVYQKSLDWWSYGVSIFFSSVISLAVWACLLSMLHESGQLKKTSKQLPSSSLAFIKCKE